MKEFNAIPIIKGIAIAVQVMIPLSFLPHAGKEHGDIGGLIDFFEKVQYILFAVVLTILNYFLIVIFSKNVLKRNLLLILSLGITILIALFNQFICDSTYNSHHIKHIYKPNPLKELEIQKNDCETKLKHLKIEDYQQKYKFLPPKEDELTHINSVKRFFKKSIDYCVDYDTTNKVGTDTLNHYFRIFNSIIHMNFEFPLNNKFRKLGGSLDIFNVLYSPGGKHILIAYTVKIPDYDSIFNYNYGVLLGSIENKYISFDVVESGYNFYYSKQCAQIEGLQLLRCLNLKNNDGTRLNAFQTSFWTNDAFKLVNIGNKKHYKYQTYPKYDHPNEYELNGTYFEVPLVEVK